MKTKFLVAIIFMAIVGCGESDLREPQPKMADSTTPAPEVLPAPAPAPAPAPETPKQVTKFQVNTPFANIALNAQFDSTGQITILDYPAQVSSDLTSRMAITYCGSAKEWVNALTDPLASSTISTFYLNSLRRFFRTVFNIQPPDFIGTLSAFQGKVLSAAQQAGYFKSSAYLANPLEISNVKYEGLVFSEESLAKRVEKIEHFPSETYFGPAQPMFVGAPFTVELSAIDVICDLMEHRAKAVYTMTGKAGSQPYTGTWTIGSF